MVSEAAKILDETPQSDMPRPRLRSVKRGDLQSWSTSNPTAVRGTDGLPEAR